MIKWIKKNWLFLLLWMVGSMLIITNVIGYFEERNYQKEIKGLNQDIKVLESANDFKERENKDLRKSIMATEEENAIIRTELQGKNRRIREIMGERNEWRDRVRNMPASVVVIETRQALQTEEIWEREDGVLFSLSAARTNLNVLGQFSLLEEERKTLTEAYELSRQENTKLRQIIKFERTISANLTEQRANDQLIIGNWRDKFDLSEGMRKKARAKGRKEGTIIGGAIVTILWIFLGK